MHKLAPLGDQFVNQPSFANPIEEDKSVM